MIKSKVEYATIFGKTWDLHVRDVLKTSLEENILMIKDTVSYLLSCGLTVFYDAEHFFDAFNANKDYSIKCLLAAQEAGANAIVLCDTNGGTLTSEVTRIIADVRQHIKAWLGIHCHNDCGLAIA